MFFAATTTGLGAGLASALAFFFFLGLALVSGGSRMPMFLRQVHHVAVGRLHHVIAPQVFVYGFRLGGRFDDDE